MSDQTAPITDFSSGVQEYLNGLKKVLDELDINQVTLVMERLLAAYRRHASVYVFGNGGSASTASHFVNDFNKPAIGLYESLGFQRIGVNRALIW